MKKALLQYVVPGLKENGFVGEHPNYRRFRDGRIDVICFHPYPYGNAFYADISTVYPDRPKEEQNVSYLNCFGFDGDFDNVMTGHCRKIYRLKGNFDGMFFYTDVYFSLVGAFFMGVSDKKAENYKKSFFEIRVQKAGPDIYQKVCDKVNKQLNKAYKWWDKMSR